MKTRLGCSHFTLIILLSIFYQTCTYKARDFCRLPCTDRQDKNVLCDSMYGKCKVNIWRCGSGSESFPLSDTQRNTTVKQNNDLRKNSTDKVSNMYMLSYSEELEFVAQCMANDCQTSPYPCMTSPKYDFIYQAYYVDPDVDLDEDEVLELAINDFFTKVNMSCIDSEGYSCITPQEGWPLVDPNVWFFGCGKTKGVGAWYVTCYYGIGPTMYELIVGEPCKSCNGSCNDEYKMCDHGDEDGCEEDCNEAFSIQNPDVIFPTIVLFSFIVVFIKS